MLALEKVQRSDTLAGLLSLGHVIKIWCPGFVSRPPCWLMWPVCVCVYEAYLY